MSIAISGPGILLAQMAATRAVIRQGLDLYGAPPVAMAGHSQGVVAVESLKAQGTRDAEMLAILQLMGAAGSLMSRRRGMVGRGDKSPMVSVTNAEPERIADEHQRRRGRVHLTVVGMAVPKQDQLFKDEEETRD